MPVDRDPDLNAQPSLTEYRLFIIALTSRNHGVWSPNPINRSNEKTTRPAYRARPRWRPTRRPPPSVRECRASRPSAPRTCVETGRALWRNPASASCWRRKHHLAINILNEQTTVEIQEFTADNRRIIKQSLESRYYAGPAKRWFCCLPLVLINVQYLALYSCTVET